MVGHFFAQTVTRRNCVIATVVFLKSFSLMNRTARSLFVPLLAASVLLGCSGPTSGPASVTETSVARVELADRIQQRGANQSAERNWQLAELTRQRC